MNSPVAPREIDPNALMIVTTRYALPPCLHIPVAARDMAALERFIGDPTPVFRADHAQMAFRVHVPPAKEMDDTLMIWDMPGHEHLHRNPQVWVHVDYRAYRAAYQRVYPADDISALVVDHVRNRRVARVMGFSYVRVVAISRQANSSSGGLSEKWEVDFQSKPEQRAWHTANYQHIQYADVGDLAKMLDLTQGGTLHENVNEFQWRLREKRQGQ